MSFYSLISNANVCIGKHLLLKFLTLFCTTKIMEYFCLKKIKLKDCRYSNKMKLLMSKINDIRILLIIGFNGILIRILMQKAFLNVTMSFPKDRITLEKIQLQFLLILNFAHLFSFVNIE